MNDIDGITQRVDDEPVPASGSQMLIVPNSDVETGTAHFTNGVLLDSWRDRGLVTQHP